MISATKGGDLSLVTVSNEGGTLSFLKYVGDCVSVITAEEESLSLERVFNPRGRLQSAERVAGDS